MPQPDLMPEKIDISDIQEREWEVARKVISDFDERRHDLRKYGISFVAGLLTAQYFIDSAAPRPVKVMVTIAILSLIFILRLTEADYELFQRPAVTSAEEREGLLGFNLTSNISSEYHNMRMWIFVDAAYILLALTGGVLGLFVLSPRFALDSATIIILIAMTLVMISIIVLEAIILKPAKTVQYLGFLFTQQGKQKFQQLRNAPESHS